MLLSSFTLAASTSTAVMITSASVNTFESTLDLFNFVPTNQFIQDADLIKELSFIPGLREILMIRQVHALEHATVWVLSEADASQAAGTLKSSQVDNESLGGLSTEQGFYLYGQANIASLQRAVQIALQRLTAGEWDLAVHPRCGTNVSVEILLTAGLAVGIHLLLPRGLIEQLLGLGVAATTAAQLTPQLGILAQRYITTAIPFNLVIEDITLTQDAWGQSAYFVQVRWAD